MELLDREGDSPVQQLRLTTRAHEGCAVVSLHGELDIACADDLRREIAAARRTHGDHIILDLDALEFMDSHGLSVIVTSYKAAVGAGGSLSLVAPRQIVRRTLEITGLSRRLSIHPTVEAAATALREQNTADDPSPPEPAATT